MFIKKYKTLDGKSVEAQYPENEKDLLEIDKASVLGSFADEEGEDTDSVLGFD